MTATAKNINLKDIDGVFLIILLENGEVVWLLEQLINYILRI